MLQGLQLRRAEAGTLQADAIEAVRVGLALGGSQREGQNILGDGGATAYVGMLPDTAELVHRAERTDTGIVLHRDVAGQGGAIGQDAMVADGAVVTDVGVGHDQAVAANAGSATASLRSAGDGDVFADGVVIADLERGGFATVFQILRGDSQAGEGIDTIPGPQARLAVQYDVRNQLAVLAHLDIRTDGAIGAYDTGVWNESRSSHNGCWVNAHS